MSAPSRLLAIAAALGGQEKLILYSSIIEWKSTGFFYTIA
jgi:hypothetical protein